MVMKKGYVFVELVVKDQVGYATEYQPLAAQSIAAFSGRFLMRGGDVSIKAGPSDPRRRVLLEFDSYQQALDWFESPLGQEAKKVRETHAHVITFIIMEGYGQ